jgi:hypothetical protein
MTRCPCCRANLNRDDPASGWFSTCDRCSRLLVWQPNGLTRSIAGKAAWYSGDVLLLAFLAFALGGGWAAAIGWLVGAKLLGSIGLAGLGALSVTEGVLSLTSRVGRMMRKVVRGRNAKVLGAVQIAVGTAFLLGPVVMLLR